MPLRLRVIPRADQQKAGAGEPAPTERIVEFEDNVDEIRIGRRLDLELTLPFKALSGLHARLRRQGSGGGERSHTWVIEDLESKNGTFVGKSRIKPGEHRLLFAGDRVDLGPVKVMFDGHSQAIPGAEGTATIARRLVSDLLMGAPVSAPTLSVISGASKEIESLKLLDRDRPYFIGRDPGCDLVLPPRGAVAPARVVHADLERGGAARPGVEERNRRERNRGDGAAPLERGRDRDGAAEAAPDGSGGQIPARARGSGPRRARVPRRNRPEGGGRDAGGARRVAATDAHAAPARAGPGRRASQGVAAGAPPRRRVTRWHRQQLPRTATGTADGARRATSGDSRAPATSGCAAAAR